MLTLHSSVPLPKISTRLESTIDHYLEIYLSIHEEGVGKEQVEIAWELTRRHKLLTHPLFPFSSPFPPKFCTSSFPFVWPPRCTFIVLLSSTRASLVPVLDYMGLLMEEGVASGKEMQGFVMIVWTSLRVK